MKKFIAGMIALSAVLIGAAAPPQQARPQLAHATFAGGCFWCMEHPFDQVRGVVSVTSGYAGGAKQNPTYEEVSAGSSGHREAVDVVYDPRQVTYQHLVDIFWRNVDPENNGGQFCDVGAQYRSGIFFHDAEQQRVAEASKRVIAQRLKQVYTDVLPAGAFWPAEEYHQHYYKKNPVRYKFYRFNCGRDQRLERLWGKASH